MKVDTILTEWRPPEVEHEKPRSDLQETRQKTGFFMVNNVPPFPPVGDREVSLRRDVRLRPGGEPRLVRRDWTGGSQGTLPVRLQAGLHQVQDQRL